MLEVLDQRRDCGRRVLAELGDGEHCVTLADMLSLTKCQTE
jgi:hypothetical protein